MKNKMTKTLLALSLAFTTMMGSAMPAFASEQLVTGTDSQTKEVEVSADIKSVYSVSLPATIKLEYGSVIIRDNPVDGYWANIRYGVAGKIASNEVVNIVPQFPCTLTLMDENGNPTETTISVYHAQDSNNGGHGVYDRDKQCRTSWNKAEIGSCDYDGVSLTNCVYSYCCDGHFIGINQDRVEKYGDYQGNLTFNFSITKQ